jgi:hypothetical protein
MSDISSEFENFLGNVVPEPESAAVSFMITRDQRQRLYDLGWTRDEVDVMKPEMAHDILKEDLPAPTLNKNGGTGGPTFYENGFAPSAPTQPETKPGDDWSLGQELADRECARLIVEAALEPPPGVQVEDAISWPEPKPLPTREFAA